MSEAGYVYVAKHKTKPGHIKIGQTVDPDQRNKSLQGGAPGKPIEIVKSVFVDDRHAVEGAFHAMLKQARIEGEWFNIELDQVIPMLALIDRWCATSLKKKEYYPKRGATSGEGRSQSTTPRSSFRQPIVNVLKKLGGRGRTRDVLNGVKGEMNLSQADLKELISGGVVWENKARWVRLQLKEEGVLKRNSPHGWWELVKKEEYRPKRNATSGERRSQRATPKSSFRQPIVNVLKRLGGRGRARDVLNGVKEEMNLSQADMETYQSSNEVVWKKHAHFARLQLKEEGVLRRDSPHGWWELA